LKLLFLKELSAWCFQTVHFRWRTSIASSKAF